MSREEIGVMALEAGFMLSTAYGQNPNQFMPVSDIATLERFAKLVAAKEREECAKDCEYWRSKCDNRTMQAEGWAAQECANSIRAKLHQSSQSSMSRKNRQSHSVRTR